MKMSFAMTGARIAEASEASDRRVSERVPMALDARVRALGEEGCEARILNISETGFMAETREDYQVGSRVWLIMPDRERANAVVRWSAGNRIGAEFAAPWKIADPRS